MKRSLVLLSLACLLASCQSMGPHREPSSTLAPDEVIDPKFESYEGGSFEAEKKINDELIAVSYELMTRVRNQSPTKQMTRDAHAKSHGCLQARFEVDNQILPPEHRVGLFARNQGYDAWVRFSNNDHLPMRRDNEFDLRGMSIKVMGVDGPKIMTGQESAPTQDFLMYGSNRFFIADNKDYVGFIKGLRDDNAVKRLLTEQPRAAIRTLYAQWKVSGFTNPANMPYHSAVPIRLGLPTDETRTAMKYRAIPCSKTPHANPISKKSTHYLRENLKLTLDKEDVCFQFQVQLQAHPIVMPVEDAQVVWPERIQDYGNMPFSPYQTVATVRIPKQNFDTPARDQYCEAMSFTPWHALVEHKPLGRTMRMRRDLYRATSMFRSQANGVKPHEPAGFEIE